jgi:hypothetical protein
VYSCNRGLWERRILAVHLPILTHFQNLDHALLEIYQTIAASNNCSALRELSLKSEVAHKLHRMCNIHGEALPTTHDVGMHKKVSGGDLVLGSLDLCLQFFYAHTVFLLQLLQK